MCFSAGASFIAAATVGTIGIASVAHAKPHLRAIAMAPLYFGFQQACEGVVWLTLGTDTLLLKVATYAFLFFATMFWPMWTPTVLANIEENPNRKKWLNVFRMIGYSVAFVSLLGMFLVGNEAKDIGHHLVYNYIENPDRFLSPTVEAVIYFAVFFFYLVPTIGSFFISSLQYAWIFGALLALAWAVTSYAYYATYGSVWCFFGSLISVVTYFIVRRR